mgnify:CR=1 FL=1
MPTPHIESKKNEIAESVLMPGDPLRAKYIAEKFLTDYKLVNRVRNMFAYTGYYKGKRVTVFASGMGIPSIGIYAYELFQFYDVKRIIRIGSAGSQHEDVRVKDVVLSMGAYSLSYYDKLLDGTDKNIARSSFQLNEKILKTAKKLNMPVVYGLTMTSDVFDVYVDYNKFRKNFPNVNFLAVEMEAFGLFYLGEKFKRDTACLMTVVDSKYEKKELTSEEREKSLDEMIILALESLI